jgi:translation elongation factor aEF-1 beta
MGTMLIIYKIMPTSPEVNLDEIKVASKLVIEELEGKNVRFEEEPIAFGLKAVKASFDIDEKFELEPIQNKLEKIDNVSSVEVVDMRRAFG